MCATSKLEGGFLLEGFDEFDQVAFLRGPNRQKMHVVRHDAIRMYEKRANAGVFSQAGDEPRCDARVCAEAPAIMEAERDEIHGSAVIVAGWKPDVFALEFSGGGHEGASRVCRAEGRGATIKAFVDDAPKRR